MVTLQATELIEHYEDYNNKLDNRRNTNDVKLNGWHGPEVMHDLHSCVDNKRVNINSSINNNSNVNNNNNTNNYDINNINNNHNHKNNNDNSGIRQLPSYDSALDDTNAQSGNYVSAERNNSEAVEIENCYEDDKHVKCAKYGDYEHGKRSRYKVPADYDNESEEEAGDDHYIDDDADQDDLDIETEENIISQMGGWTNGMPVDKIFHETSAGQVLPSLDKTNFGDINIKKSANVRVGNTTLYKGPVTIKQFVYNNTHPGHDIINNNGDIVTDGRISDANPNDIPIMKDGSNVPIFPIHGEYNRVREWLWTWRCAAILCIMALVLATTVVVISMSLSQHAEFPTLSPAIDPDDILYDGVRFIQRVEWGAQPPNDELQKLEITPVPYVIISHTASEGCNTQIECVQRVRLAQMMHIEINNWSDIAYNFLVGGDGQVYVGRGWDTTGAHAFGFNTKSIGISCIGTFTKVVPPKRQLRALEKLIEIGIKNGKIAENYKLLGHRQVSETASPGNILYSIIRTWDHWSPKPFDEK